MTKLMLRHKLAMGDTVLLTALCRDIAMTYPGRFEIVVETNFRDVFDQHPYARIRRPAEPVRGTGIINVEISYRDGIRVANQPRNPRKIHMLTSYHEDFARKLRMPLSPLLPYACLPLTPQEQVPKVPGDYWLIVAGGKQDATVKVWRPSSWQALVNRLVSRGVSVVQTGALHGGHFHPTLSNVINMVGQCPTTRDLLNLVYNAQGVICPITGVMHIAAAYQKPCVVIAGGREAPWWEGYTNEYKAFGTTASPLVVEHRYLHTLGKLDCCRSNGCWKHRVVPMGVRGEEKRARKDRDLDQPHRLCRLPVIGPDESVPRCLDMIDVEQVLAAIDSYQDRPSVPSPRPVPQLIRLDGFDAPPPARTPDLEILPTPAAVDVIRPIVRATNRIEAMHNEIIGGKLTVCVLCYGPHAELAEKCLGSIFETVPQQYLDVRVGCNAVEDRTLDYLRTLPVTKIYLHPENPGKYPVMREMFNDPGCPITTNYLAWFDDDTCCVDVHWLQKVAFTVAAGHAAGARLFGNVLYHDVQLFGRRGMGVEWFRQATWWKNRHLKIRGRGQEAPNGSLIEFVAGWFWLAEVVALRAAGVPDRRLRHNGGDITIGEQLHQAGYRIRDIGNRDKSLVWCPSKENGGRRGRAEKFQWA